MRRCSDGDGVNAEIEQFGDTRNGFAAERARDKVRLSAVGISDTDKLGPRKTGKDPGVIASHYADADYADTQQTPRVRTDRLRHDASKSPRPREAVIPSLARAGCACDGRGRTQ
jgi:hypothetical protein